MTGLVRHPRQMRDGFGQRAELPFSLLNALPRQNHFRYVGGVNEDAVNLPEYTPGRQIDEVYINVLPNTAAAVEANQLLVTREWLAGLVHAVQQIAKCLLC